jgi:hypothetical protein
MTDGLRLVPVKAEVAASDGQIRGHGQLFAAPRRQQGAVVADSQAEAAPRCVGRPLANLAEQSKLTLSAPGSRMGLIYWHFPHLMTLG